MTIEEKLEAIRARRDFEIDTELRDELEERFPTFKAGPEAPEEVKAYRKAYYALTKAHQARVEYQPAKDVEQKFEAALEAYETAKAAMMEVI